MEARAGGGLRRLLLGGLLLRVEERPREGIEVRAVLRVRRARGTGGRRRLLRGEERFLEAAQGEGLRAGRVAAAAVVAPSDPAGRGAGTGRRRREGGGPAGAALRLRARAACAAGGRARRGWPRPVDRRGGSSGVSVAVDAVSCQIHDPRGPRRDGRRSAGRSARRRRRRAGDERGRAGRRRRASAVAAARSGRAARRDGKGRTRSRHDRRAAAAAVARPAATRKGRRALRLGIWNRGAVGRAFPLFARPRGEGGARRRRGGRRVDAPWRRRRRRALALPPGLLDPRPPEALPVAQICRLLRD